MEFDPKKAVAVIEERLGPRLTSALFYLGALAFAAFCLGVFYTWLVVPLGEILGASQVGSYFRQHAAEYIISILLAVIAVRLMSWYFGRKAKRLFKQTEELIAIADKRRAEVMEAVEKNKAMLEAIDERLNKRASEE